MHSDNEEELPLDCTGADSGKDACWPTWVNVGVPVIVCVLFVAFLALMFFIPSKPPPDDDLYYDEDRIRRQQNVNSGANSRLELLSSSLQSRSFASSASTV